MNKSKRGDAEKLQKFMVAVWENRGEIAFSLFMGSMIIALFTVIFGVFITLWQASTTTPEQRFASYEDFFNQCIESEIPEKDCAAAALEYAGLKGE